MSITTPSPAKTLGPGLVDKIANFVLFQVSWFACVLSGAAGKPHYGIAVIALVVALHLGRARRPAVEALLLTIAATIGAVWDGLLAGFGWLVYPSGIFAHWVAPSWIIAMWLGFAMTLNVSMRWLRGRYALAFLFGGIGGPLAFLAGSRLGGVSFPDPLVAMAVLSAGWSAITPTLVWLAARLDGFADARRPASVTVTAEQAS